MGIFVSIVKKEAIHIVRDRRTMVITLLMPLALLLLFGFAISTEVNNIRVVASADRHNDDAREIIERLRANGYTTFAGIVPPEEAEAVIRRGDADAAVILRTEKGRVKQQIIVDAANPVVGRAAAAYLQGITGDSGADMVISTTLYNPLLKSSYNFVPGIMGMIFILICAIMTSVSIVREKESGTMDLLLVSPARPRSVILGKLVPYFLLSCVILAAMLAVAYTLLDLPLSRSAWPVVAVSLVYIVLSLSIGLLVSALVDTQLSALIVSAVIFMLPVIMLSGMIFPVENMPAILRWLSAAIPARWYISAMRGLMVQQLGIGDVIREVTVLAAMTVVFLTAAITKSNRKT